MLTCLRERGVAAKSVDVAAALAFKSPLALGLGFPSLVVGRLPGADVRFGLPFEGTCNLSRYQALIYTDGEQVLLVAQGAGNATYVNSKRMHPRDTHVLASGDVLSFGGPLMLIGKGDHRENPFFYKYTDSSAGSGASAGAGADGSAKSARKRTRAGSAANSAGGGGAAGSGSCAALPPLQMSLLIAPGDAVLAPAAALAARRARAAPVAVAALVAVARQQACAASNLFFPAFRPLVAADVESIDTAAMPVEVQSALLARGVTDATCDICTCILNQPHLLPCTHAFCSGCLEQWGMLQKATCPTCRGPATAAVHDRKLEGLIESVFVPLLSAEEITERAASRQRAEAARLLKHGAIGYAKAAADAAAAAATAAVANGAVFGVAAPPAAARSSLPALQLSILFGDMPTTRWSVEVNTNSALICHGCFFNVKVGQPRLVAAEWLTKRRAFYHPGCTAVGWPAVELDGFESLNARAKRVVTSGIAKAAR